MLITRESARRLVHLVNFSSQTVSKVPKYVSPSLPSFDSLQSSLCFQFGSGAAAPIHRCHGLADQSHAFGSSEVGRSQRNPVNRRQTVGTVQLRNGLYIKRAGKMHKWNSISSRTNHICKTHRNAWHIFWPEDSRRNALRRRKPLRKSTSSPYAPTIIQLSRIQPMQPTVDVKLSFSSLQLLFFSPFFYIFFYVDSNFNTPVILSARDAANRIMKRIIFFLRKPFFYTYPLAIYFEIIFVFDYFPKLSRRRLSGEWERSTKLV